VAVQQVIGQAPNFSQSPAGSGSIANNSSVEFSLIFGAVGFAVALLSLSSQTISWFVKRRNDENEIKNAISTLNVNLTSRFKELQQEIDSRTAIANKDTDHKFELLTQKINSYFEGDSLQTKKINKSLAEAGAIALQNQQNISDLCLMLKTKNIIDFTPSTRMIRQEQAFKTQP
jgi:hypothetical protein